MAEDPPAREPGSPEPAPGRAWHWLLIVPLIGTLIPPIYNTKDPTLIGIPFFYWYQMLWIPIGVTITVLVYRATTRR
jgi:uncharacterized protein DUF3311